MEYVYEYLVFLAQAVTIVIAIIVVLMTVAGLSARQMQAPGRGHLTVAKINDMLRDLRHAMESALLPDGVVKKQHKAEAKAEKQQAKERAKDKEKDKVEAQATDSTASVDGAIDEATRPRMFVIRFEGDVKASGVDALRQEVSAVLTMAKPTDEVVVAVESPGGMVHGYGLAASQLTRFRNANIPLTVVVDKVAASGGYMMAAVANRIVAAPFAVLGSIGVVAQVPNVHRLLKKNDVDVEVLTAGKHKRTLTFLGENTDEGRAKFKEELEDVHVLFQDFVKEYRPDLDMDQVATGEAWYGTRALELKLVDELATSDEYLMRACEAHDVYRVQWDVSRKPIDRLMERLSATLGEVEEAISRFTRVTR